MSRYPFFAACLLAGLILLPACGKKTAEASETRQAQQLAELFGNVCVDNLGHFDDVIKWAVTKGLPEISDANARHVYVGDIGGSAWTMKTDTDVFIVALRQGTGECAVYGAHVDPAAFADYFDQVVQLMAAPLGGAAAVQTPDPDLTANSPYGQHIGKTRVIPLKDGRNISVAMFTFQKPGGAYQASMQLAMTAAQAVPQSQK